MIYVEHAGIAARAPETLANWYIDMLGMKLLCKTNATTYFVGYDKGACVEIYLAKTVEKPIQNNYVSGMTHLALYTDDFDGLRKQLIDRGVEQAAEPILRDDLKLALMRDAEGNLFHIVNREKEIITG